MGERHPSIPVPGLERAFEVVVELGPLEDHGMTRVGHRRVVPITGGRIHGAFDGEILAGGADLADRARRRLDRLSPAPRPEPPRALSSPAP